MSDEVLVAIIAGIGVIVSSVAAALSAWAIARINATNRAVDSVGSDVTTAKDQAAAANTAAVEARDYSKPMGNGYAEESRQAWRRIEEQGIRTNEVLIRHLSDHTAAALNQSRLTIEPPAQPADPDDPKE
jgi:hypothetical protein